MKWKVKKKKAARTKLLRSMKRLQKKNKKSSSRSTYIGEIYYSNSVSNLLERKKFYDKSITDELARVNKGVVKVTIPEHFSMAQNTEKVISILKRIFYCGMNLNISEIIFDHSKCINLGIAASTVMDTIVLAAKSYHRSKGSNLTISGNYPEDQYTKDVFIASGLVRHLQVDVAENRRDAILFKLVSGRQGSRQSAQVATKLTDYFNCCLNTQCYGLTDIGKNKLASMFSEVLDNCERHGGADSIWYALGHYQIRKGNDFGEIQLTIFNYGDSIYEGLCSRDTTSETKEALGKILQRHKQYFTGTWTEEMVGTVFSLQEGVSRLRDKEKRGFRNRGTGTVTLMDTFYRMGHTMDGRNPEMTLVSGHVCIKFTDKYRLEEKEIFDDIFKGKKRKIIAFNEGNDIYQPADENVMLLREYFPGTVLSLKFYLDNKYLEKIASGQ